VVNPDGNPDFDQGDVLQLALPQLATRIYFSAHMLTSSFGGSAQDFLVTLVGSSGPSDGSANSRATAVQVRNVSGGNNRTGSVTVRVYFIGRSID